VPRLLRFPVVSRSITEAGARKPIELATWSRSSRGPSPPESGHGGTPASGAVATVVQFDDHLQEGVPS
jgi:hypothetical protein